jgi:hypothetical protein
LAFFCSSLSSSEPSSWGVSVLSTLSEAQTGVFNLKNQKLPLSRRKKQKLRKQLMNSQIYSSTFVKPTMRIVKRDIRKHYCEMITNVLNNHDKVLLKEFLSTFCFPDCSVSDLNPNGACAASKACNATGIDDIASIWFSGFDLMPDFTFQLNNSMIYAPSSHSGTRSRIVSKLVFQGTKVFDLNTDLHYVSIPDLKSLVDKPQSSPLMSAIYQQFPQVRSVLSLIQNGKKLNSSLQQPSGSSSPLSSSVDDQSDVSIDGSLSLSEATFDEPFVTISPSRQSGQVDDFTNLIEAFGNLVLSSYPVQYKIEGILTTFLDENNKITKFQFCCLDVNQKFLPPNSL